MNCKKGCWGAQETVEQVLAKTEKYSYYRLFIASLCPILTKAANLDGHNEYLGE